MRYEKYLQLVEITSGRKNLEKLLDLIGNDFTSISSSQYKELSFLILYKLAA